MLDLIFSIYINFLQIQDVTKNKTSFLYDHSVDSSSRGIVEKALETYNIGE